MNTTSKNEWSIRHMNDTFLYTYVYKCVSFSHNIKVAYLSENLLKLLVSIVNVESELLDHEKIDR